MHILHIGPLLDRVYLSLYQKSNLVFFFKSFISLWSRDTYFVSKFSRSGILEKKVYGVTIVPNAWIIGGWRIHIERVIKERRDCRVELVPFLLNCFACELKWWLESGQTKSLVLIQSIIDIKIIDIKVALPTSSTDWAIDT